MTDLITASALEAVDSDAQVSQHQAAILQQAKVHNLSAAQISRKLHDDLSAANVHHYTLTTENIYEQNEQGNKNAQIWFEAETLNDAKAKIQQVIFTTASPFLSTETFTGEGFGQPHQAQISFWRLSGYCCGEEANQPCSGDPIFVPIENFD